MHAIDPGSVRGEQLATVVLSWLRDDPDVGEAGAELLDAVADTLRAHCADDVVSRVPRRGALLHRGIAPTVAAGLALAQGVIGVPSRVAAEHPTYMADTGVPLTVVPAEVFAAHGAASAAPGTAQGVFVVTGAAGGVNEAAGALGASIEYVDGGSPRAIGVAIASACRSARAAAHVIVVSEVQRVAAPRAHVLGVDPDLIGTERIATSVLPPAAAAVVDIGDELLSGPSVVPRDVAEAHAVLVPLRELSPSTFDLQRETHRSGRASRSRWELRRRALRAVTGVNL